jgi:hypothetical protein
MILHVPGCDMIVEVFSALPLFTENKQPLFKHVSMEFVSGTSGLCMDEGNNTTHLVNKVLVILHANTTPGGNEQHTQLSGFCQEKVPGPWQ